MTSGIFRDEPTFADLSWLWAAITIFLIICTPMWPTYSESWVRALSHGTTHEKFFTKKFSRRGGFSKKRRFWPFLVSPPPQQSKASLLGQFKSQMTSTWLIWSVMGKILMWTLKKWRIQKKLASLPTLKSAYPESCRPKKLFLRRFFLENHYSDPFRSNDAPQVLYMAGKLWISALRW